MPIFGLRETRKRAQNGLKTNSVSLPDGVILRIEILVRDSETISFAFAARLFSQKAPKRMRKSAPKNMTTGQAPEIMKTAIWAKLSAPAMRKKTRCPFRPSER